MSKLSLQMIKAGFKTKQAVTKWIKEEKSAGQSTETSFWMYAGIVLAMIAVGLIVAFLTGGLNSIGSWFQDAVTGNSTSPNGWGK